MQQPDVPDTQPQAAAEPSTLHSNAQSGKELVRDRAVIIPARRNQRPRPERARHAPYVRKRAPSVGGRRIPDVGRRQHEQTHKRADCALVTHRAAHLLGQRKKFSARKRTLSSAA